MKVYFLFTGSGPLVIGTTHESVEDPALLAKLAAKGIYKFIAHEIPYEIASERYHGHLQHAVQDLHESDDLRVIDYNGERAFKLFKLKELGPEILHEPDVEYEPD